MVRCNDTLTQLLETFGAHGAAEFPLTEKETLHQWPALELEIRQHAKLFHGLMWQALAFVDHEKHAFAFLRAGPKIRFEASQKRRLAVALVGEAKAGRHHAQKIVGLHLRRDDVGPDDVLFRQ